MCFQVCQMLTLSPGTVYELANVPTRVEEFMFDNGLIKLGARSSARARQRAAHAPLQGGARLASRGDMHAHPPHIALRAGRRRRRQRHTGQPAPPLLLHRG
jgi:hypothetical protein